MLRFLLPFFFAALAFGQGKMATIEWVLAQGYSTGGGSIPAGVITLSLTSCPAGFSEVTALDGKFLQGTLAAHGDAGGTGGNATITPAGTVSQPTLSMNSYTPAGTNSTVSFTPAGTITWPAGVATMVLSWPASVPTFSGSALAGHAHELPFQLSSTTATRQIAAATFGTGTSRAATGASAAGSSNTTSAAVALSQSVSAGTPTGTIAWPVSVPTGVLSWPAGVPTFGGSSGTIPAETFSGQAATLTGSVSQPAFSGNAVDPRPPFVKVIFCSKD